MSGVSPLFTVEFFELVRARLKDGGLFCQWIHLYNLAEESLRTVVGGFTDVFPEAALFVLHDGDALLIGAKGAFPSVPGRNIEPRIARLADELAPYGITDFRGAPRLAYRGGSGTGSLGRRGAAPPGRPSDPGVPGAAVRPRHHRFPKPPGTRAARLGTAFRALRAGAFTRRREARGPRRRTPLRPEPDWALELARQALELDPAERSATAALVRARSRAGGGRRERKPCGPRWGPFQRRARPRGRSPFRSPSSCCGRAGRRSGGGTRGRTGRAGRGSRGAAPVSRSPGRTRRLGLRRGAGAGGARKRPAGCGRRPPGSRN